MKERFLTVKDKGKIHLKIHLKTGHEDPGGRRL
jgi:hypothetical protein